MFRQLALAMSCDERKCPSQPSETAERKTNRQKRQALRNACTANLRACLLFSSIMVSTDFGASHNLNINLCGTESECASRLWYIETTYFLITLLFTIKIIPDSSLDFWNYFAFKIFDFLIADESPYILNSKQQSIAVKNDCSRNAR